MRKTARELKAQAVSSVACAPLWGKVGLVSDVNRNILRQDKVSSLRLFASCVRHSQLTKEMFFPLRLVAKETLFVVVCVVGLLIA